MRQNSSKKSKNSQKESADFRKLTTSYYTPEQTPTEPNVSQPKKSLKIKRIIVSLLLFLLVGLLVFVSVIAIWNYNNFASASQKLFGSSSVFDLLLSGDASQTSGRTNILIVGYSVDDPNHAGAQLTDSLLLFSVDHAKKSSFLLSIPRDLYVQIDNYGNAKINEALQAGERNGFQAAGYPDGGIGLLRKTVSETFDVPIHYHAIINYSAVRDTVEALNGITVDIQSDNERGFYDPNFQPHEGGPLELSNGVQTIDGVTALKLVRARGAAGNAYGFALSDFTRTQNQQVVLKGILDKLSWNTLLDPRKNGELFNAVANNVHTDVQLNEVI